MKCSATTKRRGTLRPCAQPAIVTRNGKWYCYYHDPEEPRRFGEGYKEIRKALAPASQEGAG